MMLHALTIVLVILKALGYLDISWWLVFIPSILSFVLITLFFVLAIVAKFYLER
jgi:hypothetical protein